MLPGAEKELAMADSLTSTCFESHPQFITRQDTRCDILSLY